MTTYGRPETARAHPPTPAFLALIRDITALEKKKALIIEACEHHLVPQKDALKKLLSTAVKGVYNAGTVGEINGKSNVYFTIHCTKCDIQEQVSLTDRCPVCAEVTKGEWRSGPGEKNELVTYFGHREFYYNDLWLISCTSCDFKAAGLRWDR